MAKKTTGKLAARKRTTKTSTRKTAGRSKTATGAPKAQRRNTAAGRKAASKRSATSTARRKTAARSNATRQQRNRPAPKPASRLKAATAAVRGRLAGAVAAVTTRLPWSKSDPDALQILEQEHRRFEALLSQGEDTTEQARKTRRELLDTLTAELNAHELMEEQVLYPALQSHPEAREVVLEGFAEHHVADLIVGELHTVATDDEQWGAKFKVLKENIEHHIREEEGEMFPVARSIFSREELLDLASQMLAIKRSQTTGSGNSAV